MNEFFKNKDVTKILIAEDSPTQAEQLKFLLEQNDFEVVVARDGQEALWLLDDHQPALIISDIQMPGINGFELCQRIKSKIATRNIPVILLTSLSSKDDVLVGIECGADSFINKPFNEDFLISHVKRMLIQSALNDTPQNEMRFETLIGDKKHLITANPQRMLSLLISTYEAAINKNKELGQAENALRLANGNLEEIVEERTAALQESEARFRSSFENSAIGKALISTDGKYSQVNQALCDITGYTMEELCQKTFHDITFSGDLEADLNFVNELLDGKRKTYQMENRYIHKKGDLVWVFRSVSMVKGNVGDPLYFISEVEDITPRKRAEEALILSEERYKRITEGLTDYLYTVKVKDGKAVKTIHSEACRAITGYTPKEFADDPCLWINMVVPEERKFVAERASEILNSKELIPIEHRIIHKDGEIRWVMDTTIPKSDADGRLVSYDGVIQDITKRKQAEFLLKAKNEELAAQNEEKEKQAVELVIAKERAEESDKLKSAFLTNMSHEIRTPMNGILGFADLLKEPGLTGDQQKEYISIIEKSGARMLNIINEIVDISKIESGLMTVSNSEVNINVIMECVYSLLKPDAEDKCINLSFKNSLPANETLIITDSQKLYSILTNLVKNAIKYTDKGSIEFGYNKKGNDLEFYVKDTGIGIPEDRQKAIFERFIQADIADKQARQGAGLGLSIAKAYVEMLGGKIWVISEEGKGSIFCFSLPYNVEQEVEPVIKDVSSEIAAENHVENLKILVVEDDETSEMLLLINVEKYGKEVLKARTGSEAIEICRDNPDLNLILMDIQIPGLNGFEATRQIRQFNKDVVIIAQTAFGLSGDSEKAIEAGCDDYIAKPIDKARLQKLIQMHFEKN